jgi:RNA recognition motif-containing protein
MAVWGREAKKGNPVAKRLFIGNLSFNVTEQELQEAFAQWGASEVTIPTSDSGRPKGFGFVSVADEHASAAIAAMDGKDLAGRTIAVNEARPREDRGGGGGYGGGRGGGYGGGGGGGRGRERW